MANKSLFFVLQVVVVAFAIAGEAPAQTTSGLITGTIEDPSGAVLPDVRVELNNQGTGVERRATTDGAGHYSAPELQPGVYDVSIRKEGFATQKLSNVHLEVNQSLSLNFKMSVSSTTQSVEVQAEVTTINTTSATQAEVIGHNAIV